MSNLTDYIEVPIEDVKPGSKVLMRKPVEPEVEVVWGPGVNQFLEYRILECGTVQTCVPGDGKWKVPQGNPLSAGIKIAADYASLHAKTRTLEAKCKGYEEKLREIKEATKPAMVPWDPPLSDWLGTAHLVELCRGIEL